MRTIAAFAFVISLLGAAGARAQGVDGRIPFLTKAQSDYLLGEVSGDRAYEHVRWYTHWHRPFASDGLMAAARYTEEQAKSMGLSNVILTKTPHEGIEWTPLRGELWISAAGRGGAEYTEKICDIGSVQLSLLDRSRSAEVEAEIADAGAGDADKDYEGRDVAGKLVLAFGAPAAVMEQAVWTRGAAGIIVRPDPERGYARPDQVPWRSIPDKSKEGKVSTFAFGLSHRQGVALAQKLKLGRVRARASVEVKINDGWLVMVEATIPGTDPAAPCVLFTGHLQEERFSANDDASGCANTLEVARALAKGIASGALPRPRRSLRFWWTTEIVSEDRLFAKHPEVAESILCNINQDMVGANQAQDTMRVQNITKLPWSRAHVLDDVVEEIVNYLIDGNTAQLAGLQAGVPPFPFAVWSKLGTRHRYNARFVPYHANTDHQCFVAPPIGIPGVTFTNWPDDYIHSTDDDLWNLDPTQLQRNALAAAAAGYAMARFAHSDEETLAMLVRAHASRRMGGETEAAARALRESNEHDRAAALRDALGHVRASVARERWALESVTIVAGAKGGGHVGRILATLPPHEAGASAMLRAVAGVEPAAPSEAQTELSKLSPKRIGGVADYQANVSKAKVPAGLHRLLTHEILCLCDASVRHARALTGLQIYEIVAAQARSAGAWYYGSITPEQTLEYLRSAEAAGLVSLK